jgi:hypothetical protein
MASRRQRRSLALLAVLLGVVLLAVVLWLRRDASRGPPATGTATASAPRPRSAGVDWRRPAPAVARLQLTGTVVDASGAPVEGATVRLAGDAAAQRASGPAGAFAFADLRAGAYFLDASHEDAAAAPVRVHLDATTGPVVLRLHAGGRLEVAVVSRDDERPIRGATVEVVPGPMYGDEPCRAGTTDEAGRVQFRGLAPGSYGLLAVAPGFRLVESPLPPQAGLAWQAVLRLPRGAAVRGRVLGRGGAPIKGAVVRPFPAELENAFVPRPRASRHATVTDERGEFVYPALDAGAFRVQATHEGYLPGWSPPFSADGHSAVEGVTVRLDEGATAAGLVVGADDVPVPFAVVRANALEASAPGAGLRQVVADERGRFVIGGLPRTTVDLVATTAAGTSENTVIDLDLAPHSGDIVLRVQHLLAITGVVSDRRGAPVADASIVCVGLPRGAVGLRPIVPETTDADGRFACRGLAPGDYSLTAIRPYPNNNQSAAMRSAGARAAAGDDGVALVLPDDGTLRGRIARADGSVPARFGVQLDAGGAPRVFDSPDGRFELGGLAPRAYDVRIMLEGAPPAELRAYVPEGGVADLGTVVLDRR